MPDRHPPPPGGPPGPLRAALERDFGSVRDFLHALDLMCHRSRRGSVCLICTPDGRLRLVPAREGRPPRGLVLYCADARGTPPPPPPWRDVAEHYEGHLGRRPPYPMP